MSRPRRSFFAYASAMLGLLSLMAVACFHFPELLTSREFRAAYNERVVSKVAARLRGSVHRAVEGGVVKIKVRY